MSRYQFLFIDTVLDVSWICYSWILDYVIIITSSTELPSTYLPSFDCFLLVIITYYSFPCFCDNAKRVHNNINNI